MTKLERIKAYKILCGIKTNKEIKTLGGYKNSEQYLGGILNGQYNINDSEYKELHRAINLARAKKMGYMNHGKPQDEM